MVVGMFEEVTFQLRFEAGAGQGDEERMIWRGNSSCKGLGGRGN